MQVKQRWIDGILVLAAILVIGAIVLPEAGPGDPEIVGELQRMSQQSRLYEAVIRHSALDSTVTLIGEDGNGPVEVHLGQTVSPVLLYGIDPGCSACLRNLPLLNRLSSDLECGVTLGVEAGRISPSDLAALAPAEFKIVRDVRAAFWDAFPFATLPWLALVGSNGKLLGIWQGEELERSYAQVSKAVSSACNPS